MSKIPATLGGIARSKAGRDQGKLFVVLSVSDNMVTLTDGCLRPVERAKRKKLRHVAITPHRAPGIMEMLSAGQAVENHHIRKSLQAFLAENEKCGLRKEREDAQR